jgi:hypothetical protein
MVRAPLPVDAIQNLANPFVHPYVGVT